MDRVSVQATAFLYGDTKGTVRDLRGRDPNWPFAIVFDDLHIFMTATAFEDLRVKMNATAIAAEAESHG